MDPYDAYWNQRYYAEWDEVICLNGNLCTHPNCPEHEVRDFWDKTDWPTLADSDPWWDGLQSQTDYRRMMHYFDVRGGTANG